MDSDAAAGPKEPDPAPDRPDAAGRPMTGAAEGWLAKPDYSAAAEFWEGRYDSRDLRWDLGEAAPPLVEWFARPSSPRPPLRVLVPGCGSGHDALHLAQRGFAVTAVDFAEGALERLRRRRRSLWIPAELCRALRADVLRLPARLARSFDLLVEHTCFCALDPGDRDLYVAMAASVLVPEGRLVGLFYPFRAGTPGPPFPVSEEEIRRRFGAAFEIVEWETPASSVERRRGEERRIVMRRR